MHAKMYPSVQDYLPVVSRHHDRTFQEVFGLSSTCAARKTNFHSHIIQCTKMPYYCFNLFLVERMSYLYFKLDEDIPLKL